mmetsp:Transcript_7413/g.20574  ORF Transcript_7413/g.20574 Transcript_7413/m.20574 type:complete len:303 (-) Transcript_7413:372-1280(-)
MVASLDSPDLVKTVTVRSPISCCWTDSTKPISSGNGVPSRTRAVAPTAWHNRRSSHLEETLRHKRSYLSMKCMAISEIDPPLITTSIPASAIPWIISSIFNSSLLLYVLRSSAVFITTVPLASVLLASIPLANTAILQLDADFRTDSRARVATYPSMRRDWSVAAPKMGTVRIQAAGNTPDPSGKTSEQASATTGANKCSVPYCLDCRTGLIILSKFSLVLTCSIRSQITLGKSSSWQSWRALAYPAMISGAVCCQVIFWINRAVCQSNSPAKLRQKLVASPHSSFCFCTVMLSRLAAGCWI